LQAFPMAQHEIEKGKKSARNGGRKGDSSLRCFGFREKTGVVVVGRKNQEKKRGGHTSCSRLIEKRKKKKKKVDPAKRGKGEDLKKKKRGGASEPEISPHNKQRGEGGGEGSLTLILFA